MQPNESSRRHEKFGIAHGFQASYSHIHLYLSQSLRDAYFN